jgi:hypothetical protein
MDGETLANDSAGKRMIDTLLMNNHLTSEVGIWPSCRSQIHSSRLALRGGSLAAKEVHENAQKYN